MQKPLTAVAIALAALTLTAASAEAQRGLLDRAKQKAREAVEKKADEKSQEKPEEPVAKPAANVKSAPAAEASEEAAPSERPGEGAWANYDFKPGDRVLFFDDFAKDEVGDFPKRMEFRNGALEIVDWKGTRYLRASEDSQWDIDLGAPLPAQFTLEFDYMIPNRGSLWIYFGDENKRVIFGGDGWTEVWNGETNVNGRGRSTDENPEKLRRGRILADGKYFKVYLDDKRTLNVPNADLGRSTKISFHTDGNAEKPSLFGNFRIAAGGRKLYDALAASGRVATQGVYFDTGSDRIRPESSPTLKEIGAMLAEHPDLKLTIEGHTDDVGAAAANQALSQKRAEAVKAVLVSSYGADASRLTAKGLGSTKPAVPGTTPEARQQNRRVELVKM